MTLPAHIATVGKNSAEEVRITLDEFKGAVLVDVRIFAEFASAKVPMPTKKGVSLNVSRLPELIAALRAAEFRALELGLLQPGGANG